MARRSKRYKKAAESIDSDKLYTLEDAIAVDQELPRDTFLDESVDLAINSGRGPKTRGPDGSRGHRASSWNRQNSKGAGVRKGR